MDLGLWADVLLIAPATAINYRYKNGQWSGGQYAGFTTYLSAKAPVFVAPAMDLDMYAHPSTRKNLVYSVRMEIIS